MVPRIPEDRAALQTFRVGNQRVASER